MPANYYNPVITEINRNETLRYAGLTKAENFPEDLIKWACDEARALIKPQAIWQKYQYAADSMKVNEWQQTALVGNSITRHLRNSTEVIIMAVSIGQQLEQAVKQYFRQGEYTRGLLLDAAGTTAVETAADSVSRLISEQAAKSGMTITSRFSPGYGDWNITVQPTIVTLANAEQIGITVTESCMLIPRKSVTAIIGLQPDKPASCCLPADSINCKACTKMNCLARKEQ